MGLLIDTDLFIEEERGAASVEGLVGKEEWAISVITVSELLHGVHRATVDRAPRRRAFVERLLAEVEAIPIDAPVARVHSQVWSELAARGETVGLHDLWIAATALAYGLGVATRNRRDFDRVPGVRVLALED